MQHFFVPPSQVEETEIIITGSDVNHMKNVLRMGAGEELTVSDGNNCRYLCRVKEYADNKDLAVLDILERQDNDTELSSRIYLFQALPKQDKMEFIVQKAVELGVYRVIPVAAKRCVVKLDEKKARKRRRGGRRLPGARRSSQGAAVCRRLQMSLALKRRLRRRQSLTCC